MKARTRAAFTLVELLTVIAIIGLLISILLPSLGRAREMAHRTGCLANQAIIMKGILVYAKDSDGKLPNWGQAMPGFATSGQGWDWNGVDNTAGAYSPGPYRNDASVPGSVRSNSRNYYILIRKGLADPKNFQCHSDSDGGQPFLPADPSIAFDFQHRAQNSFSFQYQNPAAAASGIDDPVPGWATSTGDDPKLVVIADKSPLFRAIAAIASPYDAATGYTYTVPNAATRATDSFFLALLRCESQATVNTSTGAYVHGLTQDEVTALNSQNHKGEGQNIARLDGSGAFALNPWQGAGSDNIWTVQDSASIQPVPPLTTSLPSLVARVAGAFPDSTIQNADTEDEMLQQWMAKPVFSKNKYADSFLVP